jgi:hypothetical protein
MIIVKDWEKFFYPENISESRKEILNKEWIKNGNLILIDETETNYIEDFWVIFADCFDNNIITAGEISLPITETDIEYILETEGYGVFNLEYENGDSDGRLQEEFNGEWIRFIVWNDENKIEIKII